MKSLLSVLCFGLLSASLAHSEWPINDVCPVSGKPSRPIYRVKTKDGPVSFCCDECQEKFAKNPGSFTVKRKEVKK